MYSGESENRLGLCMSLSVPRMKERRESGNRQGISCSSQSQLSGVGKYIESDGTDKVNVSAYHGREKRE